MSIRVILSTCQGQCQVTKGHERSPNSEILFRAYGSYFLITFARRVQKSTPFCNLTTRKSATEKGQVNPGSRMFKFSIWYFLTKKKCFWTSLTSGFQKCHFYFGAMSRNAPNRSLKNDVINGNGFWYICLPKICISTWNFAYYIPRHGSTTNCRFLKLWFFWNL